jgi:hypothetical protein
MRNVYVYMYVGSEVLAAVIIHEYGLLGYNTVHFGQSSTFRRNMSPPFSRSKSKSSQKVEKAGGKFR